MADNKPRSEASHDRVPGPRIPGWVWWVVFAVLTAWNVLTFLVPRGPATITLSYSAFLTQVQAANVEKVTIAGQNASGQLKTAIPIPGATPSPAATPGQKARPPVSGRFTTVLPATNDPSLLSLL